MDGWKILPGLSQDAMSAAMNQWTAPLEWSGGEEDQGNEGACGPLVCGIALVAGTHFGRSLFFKSKILGKCLPPLPLCFLHPWTTTKFAMPRDSLVQPCSFRA